MANNRAEIQNDSEIDHKIRTFLIRFSSYWIIKTKRVCLPRLAINFQSNRSFVASLFDHALRPHKYLYCLPRGHILIDSNT